MDILITGATGFIGQYLVDRLARNNDRVICLARQPLSSYVDSHMPNVEWRKVDILDQKNLIRVIPQVQMVYHLAGKTFSRERKGNPYYRVNTEGTQILVEAVLKCCNPYPRFIFLSSIAAVVGKNHGVVNECTKPDPVTRYGKSKLAAERLLLECKREHGLPVTIIRSPLVYGPGDHNFSGSTLLFKMVRWGISPLGKGTNLISLCYIENLVSLLIHLRKIQFIPHDIYFIADGSPRRLNEWIRMISEAEGVGLPRIKIPRFLVDILGKFGPHNIRKLVNQMKSNWACSISKGQQELGYTLPYSSEEGIKKTVNWYKNEGIL